MEPLNPLPSTQQLKLNIVTRSVDIAGVFLLLVTGFIDHVNTQLGTTLNYGVMANLHTVQITTAHAIFQPAVSSPAVPW
jgi:hypothetical protein